MTMKKDAARFNHCSLQDSYEAALRALKSGKQPFGAVIGICGNALVYGNCKYQI